VLGYHTEFTARRALNQNLLGNREKVIQCSTRIGHEKASGCTASYHSLMSRIESILCRYKATLLTTLFWVNVQWRLRQSLKGQSTHQMHNPHINQNALSPEKYVGAHCVPVKVSHFDN
jgi:hypothetical protein